MLEGGNQMRGDEGARIWGYIVERIKADGKVEVAGIEIQDVVGALGRHRVDDSFGQIAMWIEKRKAATGCEVLQHEGEQQGGFTGAGLADHVHVAAAIFLTERNLGIEGEARCGGA